MYTQDAWKYRRRFIAMAFAFAALVAVSEGGAPALAQQGRPPQAQNEGARGGGQPAEARRPENTIRLPADSVTEHTIELPDRPLLFKATAGSIPLNDAENGNLQAEVAYLSFVLQASGETNRPVTFLFNGGPGAASAYLDVGAIGPWRVPFDNITYSATPATAPNAETWLDFTDLVFIDPVTTGYSHIVATGDNIRRNFYSIDGDANANAVVIRKWIEKNGRQNAVKFLVGESYGGFRVPKVAHALTEQGVGVRGLILLSPVLDFSSFGQRRHNPMAWVTRLPSMAATVFESKAPFNRDALREVETYASGDYLRDLMHGERDSAAIERMTPRVAAYTGLDAAEVKKLAARVDTTTFRRELNRSRGRVASAYDPTITAYDPTPFSATSQYSDPQLDAIGPALTSAMTALYQGQLKWRVEQPYRLLNGDVSRQWNWGGGRTGPEVVDDIRKALAADPDLQVLIAHGASDLVTPYFANQLIIEQLPVFGSADRLKLNVYGGGHMFYSRDASRRAFRADALALYRAALQKE